MGQILLLAAGFLVLVAISASSVIFVDQAREDSRWVVHTVEVENQISTVLLQIRRAESAVRGYLLTSQPQFLGEYETAAASVAPGLDKLLGLTGDNKVQIEDGQRLRSAVESRLAELRKAADLVRQNNVADGIAMLRGGDADSVQTISDVTSRMRAEEERLFTSRNIAADRSQRIASIVTITGSALVIALAGISILLVRRSARERDEAEALLRDNNVNLEATVDERTADLREANNEIQRFAYIVSHDLRSPLVNIMGFTSELEQLRADIFRRIAALGRATVPALPLPAAATDTEPVLEGEDRQLAQDFA
jgi:CHASE3 domain sensor protein